eukprot:TRINITY_DN5473_c0_g1_i1.p1 TRINITY_DN5473_c0_g1~~TRINITY_DN5473_c0_g1_i1.p1  ORF type:complete len:665 (+),score=133.66 TRINITY_DN5473_c0_g1_i1:283-2277(+)
MTDFLTDAMALELLPRRSWCAPSTLSLSASPCASPELSSLLVARPSSKRSRTSVFASSCKVVPSASKLSVSEPVAKRATSGAKQSASACRRLELRQEALLASLCAGLRRLSRERRLAVLQQHCSHAHRVALQRWMLEHGGATVQGKPRDSALATSASVAVMPTVAELRSAQCATGSFTRSVSCAAVCSCPSGGPEESLEPAAADAVAVELPAAPSSALAGRGSKRRREASSEGDATTASSSTAGGGCGRSAAQAAKRPCVGKAAASFAAAGGSASAVAPAEGVPAGAAEEAAVAEGADAEAADADSAAPAAPKKAGEERHKGVISSPSSGTRYFYALASLGMLRLSSRRLRDAAAAARHREVLAAILARVAEASKAGEPMVEAAREAIRSVPAQHGVGPADLGLRLCVSFWAHRWIGLPLTTPSFSAACPASLEAGLSAWRRLWAARESLQKAAAAAGGGGGTSRGAPPAPEEFAAWEALRDVFLDVGRFPATATLADDAAEDDAAAAAVRSRRRARLLSLERAWASHRERLAERWNQRRMAREEALQRRAVRAAQSASRLAAVAARRVAARRAARERREGPRRAAKEATAFSAAVRLVARLSKLQVRLASRAARPASTAGRTRGGASRGLRLPPKPRGLAAKREVGGACALRRAGSPAQKSLW